MANARKRTTSGKPSALSTQKQNAPARVSRTADQLAGKQREISVSEFFAKNRHLLGFDNPRKALLTTVKEAVDNSLDACEEAGILPEIIIRLDLIAGDNRFRITIEDNGPGVVRAQIDNIFGKLLYGSKFHQLKMSRGQQGIGISAAGMYGLMTTGKPMVIVTRSKKNRPAHHVELAMDTTKNRPEVTVDVETEDFPSHTGTRITIELEGRYTKGRTSVDEYLEQTAIANPHARIIYHPPVREGANGADGGMGVLPVSESGFPAQESNTPPAPLTGAIIPSEIAANDSTMQVGRAILFPRTVDELPPEPNEIKPHPRGVELGTLMRMLKQTNENQLGMFLQTEFCRVGPGKAKEICEKAGLTTRSWVKQVGHAEAEALYRAIQHVSLIAPPLDCLAPIGAKQILAGLLKGVRAEFYTASTRPPSVYRGNPFQIEVGVAFGGELPSDQPARIIRFANRVPLLYQQSSCSAFKAVLETGWKNYGLSQSRAAAPEGPLIVMIHMASVWVPFTSESKEAIADYDEIRKEMKLALQECGRKLGAYLRKRRRAKREGERRSVYERYIGEIAIAVHAIDPAIDAATVRDKMLDTASRLTALADQEFDEDGNPIAPVGKKKSDDDYGEDTIIVNRAGGDPSSGGADAMRPDEETLESRQQPPRPPVSPIRMRNAKSLGAGSRKKASRAGRAKKAATSESQVRSAARRSSASN